MSDLFSDRPAARASAKPSRASAHNAPDDYSAADIEVLEGLEPVRRRPGMYVGGTDEAAYHHLASEIIDNAMDEAVAGHARLIEVRLEAGDWLTVRDDGRGVPVDPHPKFPRRSARAGIRPPARDMAPAGRTFRGRRRRVLLPNTPS